MLNGICNGLVLSVLSRIVEGEKVVTSVSLMMCGDDVVAELNRATLNASMLVILFASIKLRLWTCDDGDGGDELLLLLNLFVVVVVVVKWLVCWLTLEQFGKKFN